MIALTKAIAKRSVGIADETKGTNITANTILPSVIDTPANRAGGFHFLNSSRRKSETFTIIRSFFR
ncbi:MAG: hypothetical protein AN484_18640 [Aphanizomenon flos-aquae WA102]|uniref:Uncharacterized protein n=1 Tax=Aphanizomenon flos-aquae WA102 TaxID=1710896 RepID=A0A1B7WYS4_APHFL|nr:MAG: hypothetical protein AN484_18640 [Aphanizomenon flos-aquae WA102]